MGLLYEGFESFLFRMIISKTAVFYKSYIKVEGFRFPPTYSRINRTISYPFHQSKDQTRHRYTALQEDLHRISSGCHSFQKKETIRISNSISRVRMLVLAVQFHQDPFLCFALITIQRWTRYSIDTCL